MPIILFSGCVDRLSIYEEVTIATGYPASKKHGVGWGGLGVD